MIYVFLAEGFEEIEAIAPIDIMRRAELEVKTVGVTGKTVCGAHGIEIKADISLDEVNINNADLIFLPGGMPGTTNLMENKTVIDLILKANDKNILISAICAAPMILGRLNLLNGRKAVCFPGFEEHLLGADVLDESVAQDSNIITAKGAGAAHKLGFKLVEILKDKKTADELYFGMQY